MCIPKKKRNKIKNKQKRNDCNEKYDNEEER